MCLGNRSAHFLDGTFLTSVVQEGAIKIDQDSLREAKFDPVAHEDQSGREQPELVRLRGVQLADLASAGAPERRDWVPPGGTSGAVLADDLTEHSGIPTRLLGFRRARR